MYIPSEIDGSEVKIISAESFSSNENIISVSIPSTVRTIEDGAFDQLIDAGFDPVYGARPLKRAIQQQVENSLAQKILAGDFVPGDTIVVDSQDGILSFEKVKLS